MVGSGSCRDSKQRKKGVLGIATKTGMTMLRSRAKTSRVTVALRAQNFSGTGGSVLCLVRFGERIHAAQQKVGRGVKLLWLKPALLCYLAIVS